MKKLLLLFAVLALSISAFSQNVKFSEELKNRANSDIQAAKDEVKVPEFISKKLSNQLMSGANSLGRKFIIAFPMNEIPTHPTQALDVYIASSEETQVKIFNELTGFERTLNIQPGDIGVLSSALGDLAWEYEVREVDDVVEKGFSIISDKPISVYVMNSKRVSTEGFLAIPVSAWGTEYRHCSYYDFNESREWASGFIVVASEKNTRVNIDLKGEGAVIPAEGGKKIGDSFSFKMDEGEVYMLRGTGTTRGLFDMSGTHITADKPIGVISFHERVMIPATVVRNGRDHLSAMMPPVQAWGSQYTSVELDRKTDKGDFFRVMAAEPNTEFVVRWYDKATGAQIGNWDGVLAEAGDFAEYHPNAASACAGNNSFTSIRGTSIFKSIKTVDGEEVVNKQKPIFVMQYSYSACWDNAGGNYDPFMFPVSTVEQFTKSTIFMTPSNKSGNDYVDNFMNLIIQGDPNDPVRNIELLSSVKYDGVPIIDIQTDLPGNEIAEGLYWVTIRPEVGPHTLEGEAKFGGYLYGFAQFDSYGWPAATAYANLGEQDTLPPVIIKENECYTYKIQATEIRDEEPLGEEPPQVDQHIDRDPQIIFNDNFKDWVINPDLETEDWYLTPGGDEDFNFIFEVEDPTQDAMVIYEVFDRALNPKTSRPNSTIDTIIYKADKLRLEPEFIDFELVRISTEKSIMVKIISSKDDPTEITDLGLRGIESQAFTFGDDFPGLPFTLEANGEIEFSVVYTPTQEWLDVTEYQDGQYDADEMFFSTECVDWEYSLKGQGGENYMIVSPWSNKAIAVQQNTQINSQQKIVISNWNLALNRQATWPLEVYGIDLDGIVDENGTATAMAPFTVEAGKSNSIDAAGNFLTPMAAIPASADRPDVVFNTALFESAVDGQFVRDIPFNSNAKIYDGDLADDTLSLWDARVISSDALLTNEIWSKTRVQMTVDSRNAEVANGYISISNLSQSDDANASIQLVELRFADNERVGDTGADAWTSLNPDNGVTGEFEIRQTDPNNPRWAQHYDQFLVNGATNNGVDIYPSVVDNVPANAYQGTINIPVQFTPKGQYENNGEIYQSREFTIDALVIVNGSLETITGTVVGSAYLPKLELTDAGYDQADAVLAGATFGGDLLEIPVTNSGTNDDLYIYSIANSENIDWTGNGNNVDDFIFDPANSTFDPRDPAMNEATPFAIAQGQTEYLRFIFSPSDDELVGEKTAFFELSNSGDVLATEPQDTDTRDGATIDRSNLSGFVKAVGINGLGTDFDALIECDASPLQSIIFENTGTEPFRIDLITDDAGNDVSVNNPWFVFYDENGIEVDIKYYEGKDVAPIDNNGNPGTLNVLCRFDASRAGGLKPIPNLTIQYTGNFYDATGDIDEKTNADIILTASYFNSKLDFDVNSIDGDQRLINLSLTNEGGKNFGVNVVLDENHETLYDDNYDNINVDYIEFVVEYRADQLFQMIDQNGNLEYTPSDLVNGWTITAEKIATTNTEVEKCRSTGTILVDVVEVKYTLTAPNGDYLRGNGDLIYPHYQALISECPDVVVTVKDITLGDKDACVENQDGEGTMNTDECIAEFRAVDPNLGPEYNTDVQITTSTMKINYSVGVSNLTKVEVVDANGNVVAVPVNQHTEKGTYEVEIPLNNLSSGAHFVRVTSLSYQETKKVMVVK
ncbi:hypothetical protein OAQ99_02670 [Candidatus Kapabacteria bacterium]|nr:hypothetical protein [Candidatus Kapabacteria bacterium]